jgi:hypothetical protein
MEVMSKHESKSSAVMARADASTAEWLLELAAEEEATRRGEIPVPRATTKFSGKGSPSRHDEAQALAARLHHR